MGASGTSWDASLIGVLSDVKGEEGAEDENADDNDERVELH
jgi:hypothetical protein